MAGIFAWISTTEGFALLVRSRHEQRWKEQASAAGAIRMQLLLPGHYTQNPRAVK
jgi:hypothetical protein